MISESAGASLVHLGIGHKSYRCHGASLAGMMVALALLVIAALLPLSANLFAVLGEPPCHPLCSLMHALPNSGLPKRWTCRAM